MLIFLNMSILNISETFFSILSVIHLVISNYVHRLRRLFPLAILYMNIKNLNI